MTPLDGWQNFYVIAGSSAGALVGLQFVVITLIADKPAALSDLQGVDAFGTPSIVHFAVVLWLSALACIPWQGLAVVAVLWGLTGLGGILYLCVVIRRIRAQNVYRPVLEDWIFYGLLPLAAYALLNSPPHISNILLDGEAVMFGKIP